MPGILVDDRSCRTGKLKEHLCSDLVKKGIKLETRVLPVGDFLWIARDTGRTTTIDGFGALI